MEVLTRDRKMQKLTGDRAKLQKVYGKKLAQAIYRVLAQLQAMPNLEEATRLSHLRFHGLTGSRQGQWALKLDENNRMIIIETGHGGNPPRNLRDITSVTIIELCIDYH